MSKKLLFWPPFLNAGSWDKSTNFPNFWCYVNRVKCQSWWFAFFSPLMVLVLFCRFKEKLDVKYPDSLPGLPLSSSLSRSPSLIHLAVKKADWYLVGCSATKSTTAGTFLVPLRVSWEQSYVWGSLGAHAHVRGGSRKKVSALSSCLITRLLPDGSLPFWILSLPLKHVLPNVSLLAGYFKGIEQKNQCWVMCCFKIGTS